jgi:hypothetical protein
MSRLNRIQKLKNATWYKRKKRLKAHEEGK